MGAPRQDEKAEAMYRFYVEGHSLAKVAAAFGVTRQSVYKMMRRRGLELRKRPKTVDFVLYGGLKYTRKSNGYFYATVGRRGLLHRHTWEDKVGPIPAGYDVHHENEDTADNRMENLRCLPRADHTRLHGRRRADRG